MYSKIKVTGTIEIITGLHIGGSGEISMIGAIDSPVVRDLLTKLPIIPGSSIKGKMRSLLARDFGLKLNQDNHNQDDDRVLRLFGSSEKEIFKGHVYKFQMLSTLTKQNKYLLTTIYHLLKLNLKTQLIV